MESIYGITKEKLEQYFTDKGEKKYKATQVFEWLYNFKVSSFDEMTNIKKDVIAYLKQDFYFGYLEIVNKQVGEDTYKYLFKLADNNLVEAVLMHHDYGYSLCVSSQVGCNMTCAFCESGRLKKVRNLNTYEMVLQFMTVERDMNIKISRVVLMGIGEPFDNYDNVIDFINILNDPKAISLGSRHITVSTSGLVPRIKDFINDGKQVNLAISLHAANDKLRSELMPINKVYNLELLISTIKEYINKTNRRVTFEYILLNDINDSKEDANELSMLLKGINCYVNLIPYNETSHIKYKRSSKDKILKFYDVLKKNNIQVTIRREFGKNVSAACGQLRANYKEAK